MRKDYLGLAAVVGIAILALIAFYFANWATETTAYSGNITRFLELVDTPVSYAGMSGRYVSVRAAEDSLEFVAAPSGGGNCSDVFNSIEVPFGGNITASGCNSTLVFTSFDASVTITGNVSASSIDFSCPGGGNATDHGALLGLVDDDHPQYILHTELDNEAKLEAQIGVGIVTPAEDDDIPDAGDLGLIDTEAKFEAELFAILTPGEGGGNGTDIYYGVINPPAGTNPTVAGANETLNITTDGLIVATGTKATDTVDFLLHGNVTRDSEWDTLGEIELAVGQNIIDATEIDTEAELESLLGNVTDVQTDNDASAARAYLSAASQSIPSGLWTKVQYGSESFDIRGEWDSAVNYQFQSDKSGYYLVHAAVLFSPTGLAGQDTGIRVLKGASSYAMYLGKASPTTFGQTVQVSTSIYLTSSDTVSIETYQASGVARNLVGGSENNTYVSVTRVW